MFHKPNRWAPKYPEFAAKAREKEPWEKDRLDRGKTWESSGWVEAPASSHLLRFQIVGLLNLKSVIRGAINTYLFVEFRKPTTLGHTLYVYEFGIQRRLEGMRVFERMRQAESPGEIVWSDLIRKKVSYRPYGEGVGDAESIVQKLVNELYN
jgi:hypothetical protein